MSKEIKTFKTYCVEDLSKLDKELEEGLISQAERNEQFTEGRFHGRMNTPEGRAIGPIMPFAVGGSEIAAIEGSSPHTSVRRLQEIKLRLVTEDVDDDKQFIYDWGNIWEDKVGEINTAILARELGMNLAYVPCHPGYWNEEFPHFLAHPDGFIIDKDTNKIFALAEVKTTIPNSGNWKNHFTVGDNAPEYNPQVQSYIKVMKAKFPYIDKAYVLVWAGGRSQSSLARVRVDYDEEYATRCLQLVEKFVEDTENGIRYTSADVDNAELIEKENAERFAKAKKDAGVIEFGSDFEKTFEELADLYDQQEALSAKIKAAEKEFKKSIEDDSKELKALESAIAKKQGLLTDKVADNNGGTYTDKNGTEWTFTIDREGFSFDKDVKAALKEAFPKAWQFITEQKPKFKTILSRTRKEELDEQVS